MPGILVNQGERISLEALVNKTAPQTLVLRLFKNDWTPVETDTEAAATEATFTGYAPVVLTGTNWAVTEGEPTLIDYPQQIFASSAAQTAQPVYGYYLTQQTSGKLVGAERFTDGPYSIANNGDTVKVTPKLTQD